MPTPLSPYAQELKVIDAHVVKETVNLQPKTALGKVAALLGLTAHPLVGQKYPGVTPPLLTWPANSANAAYSEQWQLRVPKHYSAWGAPRPLVVVVNQAGWPFTSAASETLLDDEALARGWLFLSVKCLTNLTFPGAMASLSLDAALRSVTAAYNVDKERIYLVGASRGAGVLLSWAATRQAGQALMPAAVVAFSPLLDMREWWSKLPPESGTGLPLGGNDNMLTSRAHSERPDNAAGAWGDSPAVDHRYRTHGVLHFSVGTYEEYPDFGPSSFASVDVARSTGVCLRQLPTWLIHDSADPVTVVPTGCEKLQAALAGLAGIPAQVTVTTRVGGLHGFGLLDVPGGTSSAAVMDFLAPHVANRYPTTMEVVAADDVPFGLTRPTRTDANDTCRYTLAPLVAPPGKGYALTAVERLARIEFDVSRDPALAHFAFGPGMPFKLTSSAGTVLSVKNLPHAPSAVGGSGILSGGPGIGYVIGLNGAGSVEIQPAAGGGPMSVSIT